MKTPRCPLFALLLAPFLCLAPPAEAQVPSQVDQKAPSQGGQAPSQVDLAPEDRDPTPPKRSQPVVALGAGRAPEQELVRNLTEQRFRSAAESLLHTSVGGYGELQVTGFASGGPRQWTADVRRVVLFVAHQFTQSIRVYSEFEFENVREAEVEQAFADWKVAGDYLGLRAGLVLVPMGIVNEAHEPPIFNGVARPSVETVIIPTTWRELGAGFFGRPLPELRYQLYAMAGLDPLGFAAGGFRGGSGAGAASNAKAWAAVGRVEYEPLLGVVLGASGYASDAGKNATYYLRDRTAANVSVPVYGFSLDARLRHRGLEAKVLYTEWRLPTAGVLMHTFDANGQPLFADPTSPVATAMRGGYAEVGYDVLRFFGVSHQLVPFARLEAYDTQAATPAGFTGNPTYNVRELTFGASYRPIREVVAKVDYMARGRRSGPEENQISVGIGFMY